MTGSSHRNIYADCMFAYLMYFERTNCMPKNGPGKISSGDCVSGLSWLHAQNKGGTVHRSLLVWQLAPSVGGRQSI